MGALLSTLFMLREFIVLLGSRQKFSNTAEKVSNKKKFLKEKNVNLCWQCLVVIMLSQRAVSTGMNLNIKKN